MALPNFDALRDLHNSANNLLHSPIVRKSIIHHQQEKFIHEVSETSLKLLDKCGTTRDILFLVKNHLQALHFTFRRISMGESETALEEKFDAFFNYRKKLKKEMFKRMHSLKGMKKKNNNKCAMSYRECGNLMVVVNVLKEVKETTLSIMESLMNLMAMPNPEKKQNKGYLGLKLKRVNSLNFCGNRDATTIIHTASKRLEAVDIVIEDLEIELECMFRRLIQTRVSLLNILTN